MEKIYEKQHRLPRDYYRGQVNVAFTACILNKKPFFLSDKIVDPMVGMLEEALTENQCIAPVYCFMPGHFHSMFQGQTDESDCWQAMVGFKKASGYWLRMNHPAIKWQKDFYDHVVRKSEDLGAQIRYVLENPVRRGLVKNWWEYPFCGAIGCDLKEVTDSLACF